MTKRAKRLRAHAGRWVRHPWASFWMMFAGRTAVGRMATRMATLFAPPYKARRYLARLSSRGYIAPSASIHCRKLLLGENVFVGDRVTLYSTDDGGSVSIGDLSCIHQDVIVETGQGGDLIIGEDTHIQPRVQVSAYKGSVKIGSHVQIAPNCAFYPYNHTFESMEPIKNQPLISKGGIVIEDDVWLGFGVIVLDGITIGRGSVVGAGSVVTKSIPAGSIVAGVPAKIVRTRGGETHQAVSNS